MNWRKRITINLLATWGDHVIGLAVCLVLMPFTLRILGDDHYGMWVFINAIAGYSGLLNLGFGQTLSRYVSAYHAQGDSERLNRVVNLIGVIYLATSTLAVTIAAVVAWLAPTLWPQSLIPATEMRLVILLLGINTAIGILGSVFGGVLLGLQRWDLERAMLVSSSLARFGLTLFFLTNRESGLLMMALITLGTTLVENGGLVWAASRQAPELRFGRRYLSRETFHECAHFGTFSMLDMVAAKVIENTDSIVIGCVLGPAAIVPYNVASRLCQLIVKPLQLIGQICLPQAGAYHATGQIHMLRELVTKGMGLALLLIAGYFIGASFFGPMLMQTWLGKTYHDAQLLMMVMLSAQLVGTPMKVVSGVLYGMGDARRPALTYILEAFGKLMLSLLLIVPFGLVGAAIATAVPMVLVELGLLLPYALHQLQLPVRRLWREAIAPQLLPLVALWVYSAIVTAQVSPGPGWPKLIAISAGGAVVIGTVWLLQRMLLQARHRKRIEASAPLVEANNSAAI